MQTEKIKLAVVDDHLLFRKGIISLLEENSDFDILFEASNGVELLEELKTIKPEIILLDIEMPIMNGIQATEKIKELYPDVKVLSLTMHDEEEFVSHMLEKGVSGFLLKDYGIETIMEALYSVHENGYYFNDKISKVMLKKMVKTKVIKPVFKSNVMSEREIDLIRLICKECSNKEISEILNISTRTVETHRTRILRKIGARNVAGIVMYAVKNQLLD